MSAYKDKYVQYMQEKGVKFQDLDERAVRVTYSGENMKSIPVIVAFSKDGSNKVQLSCFDVGKFGGDKMASGLITCNAMNAKFRWVKFYLDSDNDVRVEADAIVDMDTVGEECHELLLRTVSIVDDAYPEFMKALWS